MIICLCANELAGQNIVPNPGFEDGAGNTFTNWNEFNGAGSFYEGTAAADIRSGSRSLKVNTTENPGEQWRHQIVSDAIPTNIGADYTFTIWAKALDANETIRFSTNPSLGNEQYSADMTVPTTWGQLSWTFTANTATTTIALDVGQFANTYCFDDMYMEFQAPVNPPSSDCSLLPNGDFESGTGSTFTNWTALNGTFTEGTAAGEFYNGSRAVKATTTGGNPWDYQLASDAYITTIGQSYTFKIWAKAASSGTEIRFSTNAQVGNEQYSGNYTITDTWTQLSWTFTANTATTIFVLDIGMDANTYFFDDACLELPPPECLNENGGFEDGNGNNFTNWTVFNGTFSQGTPNPNPDDVYEGNRSLKTTTAGGNPWEAQIVTDAIATTVGVTYEFSIYVKGATSGTEIRFSTVTNPLYSANYTVTDTWTQITWQFTANETSTQIALDLGEFANTYCLDGACLSAICGGAASPHAGQLPIADGACKFLGNVYAPHALQDFEHYWNQVTPENSAKWGLVEGTRDVFDWTDVDAARNFALTNGYPFRFHVLVWGPQQPTWLCGLSETEQVDEIKEWFQAVATRYSANPMEYVEVVNEALNDPPCYQAALTSLNTELGTTPGAYDWIVNAFKLARLYFPAETELMINEYGIESGFSPNGGPTITADYANIISLLQADDLIDAVGMQAHTFSTKSYGDPLANVTTNLTNNLNTLAALGLPIMITELDIQADEVRDANGDVVADPSQAALDAFQKSEYERIFGLYWNHPSVIGITLWGWREGLWQDAAEAYLIDPCTGAERPALQCLDDIVDAACPLTSFPANMVFDYAPQTEKDLVAINPCDCEDALNIVDGTGTVTLFHDQIIITGAKSNTLVELSNTSGVLDASAMPIAGIVGTTDASGNLTLDYYHTGVVAPTFDVLITGIYKSMTGSACTACTYVEVAPKVFLQGPFSGTLMADDLRSNSLVPMTEPYSSAGFAPSLNPSAVTTSGVLATTGNDAIVDWVIVEVRDMTTPTTVLASKAALLQRDGDIVDTDGISAVKIYGVSSGMYHVAIRHRNHLGAMTASTVFLD